MPTPRHVSAVLGVVACASAAALLGTVAATATPASPTTTTTATAAQPKIPVTVCCGNARLTPGQNLRAVNDLRSSTLYATVLPPVSGSAYGQTETGLSLVLQTDGNLVEYLSTPGVGTTAVWSTHTTTATTLAFQSDHNVVLRDAADRALWATGTAGSSAAYFDIYGNGLVVTQDASGRVVSATGPSVTTLPGIVIEGAASPGRDFSMNVQSDGNMVLYDDTDRDHLRALWSTHTAGVGPVRLFAQDDGNLVLRQLATGRAVWASGSHGPTAYYQFDVQDDANAVLYRTDGRYRLQAVWSTHTVQ